MVSCVISNCKNCSRNITKSKTGITFHRFPRDKLRREQWDVAVNRDAKWRSTVYSAVCSDHFKPSDFYLTESGLRKLSLEAVPSINISACQKQKPTICDVNPIIDPLDSDEVIELKHKVKRLEVIAQSRKRRLALIWQQKKRLEKKLLQMRQVIKHLTKIKQVKEKYKKRQMKMSGGDILFIQ